VSAKGISQIASQELARDKNVFLKLFEIVDE
jgi:hypothetical protein